MTVAELITELLNTCRSPNDTVDVQDADGNDADIDDIRLSAGYRGVRVVLTVKVAA